MQFGHAVAMANVQLGPQVAAIDVSWELGGQVKGAVAGVGVPRDRHQAEEVLKQQVREKQ